MNQNSELKAIESEIHSIVSREGYHLFELNFKKMMKKSLVQLYVDTEAGVTADQLAELSQKIAGFLEDKGGFFESYRLDISSPGTDRPLQFDWQYKRNIGRSLHVVVEEAGNPITVDGKLSEVSETGIQLVSKNGERFIPFERIKKSVVQLSLR